MIDFDRVDYDATAALMAGRLVEARSKGKDSDTYRHLLTVTVVEYDVVGVLTAVVDMAVEALTWPDEVHLSMVKMTLGVVEDLYANSNPERLEHG